MLQIIAHTLVTHRFTFICAVLSSSFYVFFQRGLTVLSVWIIVEVCHPYMLSISVSCIFKYCTITYICFIPSFMLWTKEHPMLHCSLAKVCFCFGLDRIGCGVPFHIISFQVCNNGVWNLCKTQNSRNNFVL